MASKKQKQQAIINYFINVAVFYKNNGTCAPLNKNNDFSGEGIIPKEIKKEVQFLQKYIGTGPREAVLASVLFYFNVSDSYSSMRLSNFSDYLDAPLGDVVPYVEELENMRKSKILSNSPRYRRSDDYVFKIKPDLMYAIVRDMPFQNEAPKVEDIWVMLEECKQLMEQRNDKEIIHDEYKEAVFSLIEKADSVAFSKNLKISDFGEEEKLLMVYYAANIMEGTTDNGVDNSCNYATNNARDKFHLKRLLMQECCKLQKNQLIEFTAADFLGDIDIRLTEK